MLLGHTIINNIHFLALLLIWINTCGSGYLDSAFCLPPVIDGSYTVVVPTISRTPISTVKTGFPNPEVSAQSKQVHSATFSLMMMNRLLSQWRNRARKRLVAWSWMLHVLLLVGLARWKHPFSFRESYVGIPKIVSHLDALPRTSAQVHHQSNPWALWCRCRWLSKQFHIPQNNLECLCNHWSSFEVHQ